MFYILLIFILLFQGSVSWLAPYFIQEVPETGDLTPIIESASEYADDELQTGIVITTGDTSESITPEALNPFTTFTRIMGFQLEGAGALSLIFYVMDILLVVMAFRTANKND